MELASHGALLRGLCLLRFVLGRACLSQAGQQHARREEEHSYVPTRDVRLMARRGPLLGDLDACAGLLEACAALLSAVVLQPKRAGKADAGTQLLFSYVTAGLIQSCILSHGLFFTA